MKTAFGERLKSLREEKGVGQIELARSICVSNGIISLWENERREPKLTNLVSLAQYFEVSLNFLCGLDDDF